MAAKRKGAKKVAKKVVGRKVAARRAPTKRSPAGKAKARGPKGPPLPVPAELLAAGREADVVLVPARSVLSISGAGSPHAPGFGKAIGALYGVAYGLKFARKKARAAGDFKIGPLEGRWTAEGAVLERGVLPSEESWRWTLRLGVPADVTPAAVAETIRAATVKKGGKLEGSAEAGRVGLERLPAARMGRILHVGPYADEPASFAKVAVALDAAGLRPADAHLEIYLSDPMRTEPAKLRTVLLRELEG